MVGTMTLVGLVVDEAQIVSIDDEQANVAARTDDCKLLQERRQEMPGQG